MSDYRAIAGTSATLRNLLRDRLESLVPVTIAPPDVHVSGMTERRLNLYLYMVTEDGYLKNQEIPGRGHPGSYGRPPLSLNLHYLLTAYGDTETSPDADLQAQSILGDAMLVLHEYPIVTDDLAITNPAVGTVGDPLLDSSLLSEFEKLKITLHPGSIEEFSKIWTAIPQANLRRSVAYQVSVVQIESRRPRTLALPVRERLVFAVTFRSPQITEVFRQPLLDGIVSPIVAAGEILRIRGVNLAGPATRVRLGDVDIPIASPGDDQIDVTVPGSLQAGVHPVQVLRDLMLGAPPVAHHGFRSNAVPCALIPQIVSVNPASAGAGDTVAVEVNPPVRARQECVLLLGDHVIPAVPVPNTAPTSPTVQFELPSGLNAIPPGVYLMRIRVDGAESRLTVNVMTHLYDGPTYTVT